MAPNNYDTKKLCHQTTCLRPSDTEQLLTWMTRNNTTIYWHFLIIVSNDTDQNWTPDDSKEIWHQITPIWIAGSDT